MENNANTYNIVGIGFGPSNIALSIALEEKNVNQSLLFLESNPAPDWQPEMLLDSSVIQHHPLRDFVTPRNPVSPYGFLSYLKAENRLFEYLKLGLEFPLRKDYARYTRWVARKFDHWVSYGERAIKITYNAQYPGYWNIKTNLNRTLYAKSIILAPGRTPNIPPPFDDHCSSRIVHFTRYSSALAQWLSEAPLKSVAVIGNSQSAIEIVLDLSSRFPDLQIHNIFRSYSCQQKDTSPFTEQIYSLDFADGFYQLARPRQEALTKELWRSNYSSADTDVIKKLYVKLYEQNLDGRNRISLYNMAEFNLVTEKDRQIEIHCVNTLSKHQYKLKVDAVILATGFRNMGDGENQEKYPPLLSDVFCYFHCREDGNLHVNRDYSLSSKDNLPPLFLNGLCESTHGIGDAGSFSLLSLRSWVIAEAIEKWLTQSED